jgi:hypothetical protein
LILELRFIESSIVKFLLLSHQPFTFSYEIHGVLCEKEEGGPVVET